ncbi:hypothetical protein L596_002607 [Steinernema carpocapsae]|uniref:Uncharacterized protein n=1 Tax=Steinernema carpocapsae TaxID=34508 RepID=A0A4U8USM1_STECR|nr:hypothetical protein L596_002607 [Steinernema carpocapsae]
MLISKNSACDSTLFWAYKVLLPLQFHVRTISINLGVGLREEFLSFSSVCLDRGSAGSTEHFGEVLRSVRDSDVVSLWT